MTGTAVATKIAKIVGSKPTLELPDIGAGLGAGGLLGGAGVPCLEGFFGGCFFVSGGRMDVGAAITSLYSKPLSPSPPPESS